MGRILVTGAAGHLGANLVRTLLDAGEDVRAFSRHDSPALDGLPVEKLCGDIRDAEVVRGAVRGCTGVYHCAAKVSILRRDERELFDTNVIGTRHVLDAARDTCRVVVSGSFGAIGDRPGGSSDETVPFYPFARHTPYSRTKQLVAHEVFRAAALGQDVVLATSCAIVGPNDHAPSRMGRVLLGVANQRLRAYLPGGFEFVTTHDIAAGHVLAMHKGKAGHDYLFGSGYRSMDDMVRLFAEVSGATRLPRRLSERTAVAIAHVTKLRRDPLVTPASVRLLTLRRKADCTKARTELGYRPTSIEDAVREAHDQFVERELVGLR